MLGKLNNVKNNTFIKQLRYTKAVYNFNKFGFADQQKMVTINF